MHPFWTSSYLSPGPLGSDLMGQSAGGKHWSAVLVVSCSILFITIGLSNAKEYCQLEKFNATCPPHEAVLMMEAQYGRMNAGRCLPPDFSKKCQVNVLRHMDLKCSGRANCVVNIPDTTLYQAQQCPKDLVVYLDAEYTCVRGPPGSESICHRSQNLNLTAPEGFLTSLSAHTTGAGSHKCPWVINMPAGQRIKLTLYDFNGRASPVESPTNRCSVLAKVRELGKLARMQVICSIWDRSKVVYTSHSNRIEVTLSTDFPQELVGSDEDASPFPPFFLRYEVIGCPDPLPLEGATVSRHGEQVDVQCNNTHRSWHLVCQGTSWVGEVGNCSQDTPPYIKNHHMDSSDTSLKFPNGLWIAVIIGVALGVMLGFCLLVLVYILRKRRRKQKGSGILREANALLSETKPDVADISKADHVTYACRFHPNDAEAHVVPPDVGDGCSIPGNIQMTILHNTPGRSALRAGQIYDKPSPPQLDSSLRGAHFSTFKRAGSRPADTHSLASNCDYDRTITSITCPHNFVHYGDPSLLRQHHEASHTCGTTNMNNNNDNRTNCH